MIKERLQKVINDQITAELWSSQLYLQMAYFLKRHGWDGFAHWMKLQSLEEREHATRMADYLTDRGGIVKFQMIDVVPEGWGTVLDVFEHTYKHECMVSKMVDNIVTIAIEERDYATDNFFRSFVDEQVEEEATAADIVDRIKIAGQSGILILDNQLGQRAE